MYRAIKMNLTLFRWGRALDLALKHKVHLDTVIAYRQRFLDEFGKQETMAKFVQQGPPQVDWDTIVQREAQEVVEEKRRGGGRK